MIREGLMTVDSENPSAWSLYALGTLIRCLYYGREDFITTWTSWAGGDSYTFFPYEPYQLSSIAIIKDSRQAIVGFEGTRNWSQLWRQLVFAANTESNFCTGKPHAWFHWCFRQRYQSVLNALQPLPLTANVTLTGHSLGGAIANIFANASARTNTYQINSLVTFGQPRTGNQTFADARIANFTRLVNDTDPIPELPPPFWRLISFVFKLLAPLNAFMYRHQDDAWVIDQQNNVYRSGYQYHSTIIPLILALENMPGDFSFLCSVNHIMSEYTRRLRLRVDQQIGKPDMTVIHNMNYQMDQLDLNPATILPVIDTGPSESVFADPSTVYPTSVGVPALPLGDVGATIEQRGVAHQLFFFGGYEIMAKKFRGHDRRLLTTLQKVIFDLQKRDIRAGNPKKTKSISTRALTLPSGGSPDMSLAAIALYTQATTLLAATV